MDSPQSTPVCDRISARTTGPSSPTATKYNLINSETESRRNQVPRTITTLNTQAEHHQKGNLLTTSARETIQRYVLVKSTHRETVLQRTH
jgi:hypothetical protein